MLTTKYNPPYYHCHNSNKRAILTFRENFISILLGYHLDLPTHLWDLLHYQNMITLNLPYPYLKNMHPSKNAQLEGDLNFNHHPIYYSGTHTKVIDNPSVGLQKNQFMAGWYIGPDPYHYCLYCVYI